MNSNNEDADNNAELKKRLSKTIKQMQIEEQRKELMKQFLDSGAYQRLMNIRISNYELYMQIINILISFIQEGRITNKLSEDQFIAFINKMTRKPETRIEFKHK
ncbi:MAG: hypothetical protein M1168_02965 [Candidatus Marsarchaeota archaeon]|nr:hypothetical protein [Candidatus Marsarchaeota archaeon]MCL5094915.1 hypothetical protein [Candidatus Marsarchaeota archaeon]